LTFIFSDLDQNHQRACTR